LLALAEDYARERRFTSDAATNLKRAGSMPGGPPE